jgi:hypothetical protein
MTCAYENFGIVRTKLDGLGSFPRDILRSKRQEDRGVEQSNFRILGKSLDRLLEELQSLLLFSCDEQMSALILGRIKFLLYLPISGSHRFFFFPPREEST